MKPVSFPEQNIVFAKNQPPYLPLPAYLMDSLVVSCWQMTWQERLKVLFTGVVWFSTRVFNAPIQPQRLSVDTPFYQAKLLDARTRP